MSSAAVAAKPIIPLLRPHQVREAKEEIDQMDKAMSLSGRISGLHVDKREMNARKKRLTAQLDQLTPRPFGIGEKDAAVKRWNELADSIKEDMPSGEEMRRNPPGARQKQTAWHERHKHEVQEWKNLGLRLREGGDVPAKEFTHEDNVEILRTWRRSNDVSMDHAQIPRTRDIHIGADVANTVVFSDAEESALKQIDPAIAGSLAVLDNDQRAAIKNFLANILAKTEGAQADAAPLVNAPVPEMKDLSWPAMQKLAKSHGMNTFAQSKTAVSSWLRARHLIR